MASSGNSTFEGASGILKCLNIDRQLSCALVKDYASMRNVSLTDPVASVVQCEGELRLRDRLGSLLWDSVANVKHLECLLADGCCENLAILHGLAVADAVRLWKRDIALRIVLFRHMSVCDTLDLQRVLFLWLDSPYIYRLSLDCV